MLETLNHGDYADQLNTKFRVVDEDKAPELELIEISRPKTDGGQEFFSLIFLGDENTFLPQKLYDLEHETLGRGSIFLVPVGASETGTKYEAVFNRLKKD